MASVLINSALLESVLTDTEFPESGFLRNPEKGEEAA